MTTKRGDRHKIRRRHCPTCGRLTAIHANGAFYAHYNEYGLTCRASFTKIGNAAA